MFPLRTRARKLRLGWPCSLAVIGTLKSARALGTTKAAYSAAHLSAKASGPASSPNGDAPALSTTSFGTGFYSHIDQQLGAPWRSALAPEFKQPYFVRLVSFLNAEHGKVGVVAMAASKQHASVSH